MSMILATVWKSKVIYRKFITHKNLAQFPVMSTDRKRTGQENSLKNDDEGIIKHTQSK